MPDEVILDRLQLIPEHAGVIQQRIRLVQNEKEFFSLKDPDLLIDSLITRLQALTENIKKIQKIDPVFFKEVIPFDVVPIIRFRDLASHPYEKLDPKVILQICQSKLPLIVQAIQSYLT